MLDISYISYICIIYMSNYIVPLSLQTPSPHRFYSVPLVCGIWDNKSVSELMLEMRNKTQEHEENLGQFKTSLGAFKALRKAEDLDKMLPDKSKNWEMKKIMEFHETFFDEESGNTREQGIKQLKDYFIEETKAYQIKCSVSKKYLDDLKKEVETRALKNKEGVEENKNTFIPIIPMHAPIIFRVLLTLFSFCIYFKLIDFNLNYLIPYIPDIVIPTIILSLVLFIWEYYRLYSKARKYYKVGKTTYMFCKEKIYYLYQKIYSFYKNL